MPHWDFRCFKCGALHDWSFRSFDAMERALPLRVCDVVACGGALERIASSAAFTFADTVKTQSFQGKKLITTRPHRFDG